MGWRDRKCGCYAGREIGDGGVFGEVEGLRLAVVLDSQFDLVVVFGG